MAQRKQNRPSSTEAAPPQRTQGLFGFSGFFVSRVIFQELAKVVVPSGEPIPKKVETQVTIGYGLNDDGDQAEVKLSMTLDPDPKDKPYHIEIDVIGQFVLKSGPKETFEAFCRNNAPTILFPYVREIVHRTTQDGRHGALRLDPINIQALLAASQWREDQRAKADSAAKGNPPP